MMRRAGGFTLMETLVMLIVSALAVTLMFQALASFGRSRERIAALEGVRNNQAVLAGWVVDTIRGIVAIDPANIANAPPKDPRLGLSGDASGFEATTVSPLLADAGVPTVVRWRVTAGADGSQLSYREVGRDPLNFPLGHAVHFEYLDRDGKVHEQWPPKLGKQDALPEVVELVSDASGQPAIAAAIAAPYPQPLAPYAVSAEP